MTYQTSKAVVFEKPREAKLRSIKLTGCAENGFIAKTTLSAISTGTDMKTWRGEQHPEQLYYPCVPGYENVGIIVESGKKSSGFSVNDRVMINECRKFGDVCAAWGGNSLFTVKDNDTCGKNDQMAVIPAGVSDRDAVLAYLACVALKGVYKIPFKSGDTVLVIGAGMVGISALQIIRILHPEVKIICMEKNSFRRKIAEPFCDLAVSADDTGMNKILDFTNGRKADVINECSGNPEVVGTLHRYLRDDGWDFGSSGGHIHLQGDYPQRIIMDAYHRWFVKNCTISLTCAIYYECKNTILNWISEGKFRTDTLPVEIWPVGKCTEAYEYQEKNKYDVFKIIFDWRNE
ncbi:MAG: zinc-binding dehydrogenase [Spirochaetes bacterium GWF1_41_5]|nr:MAG: zinc-binding dehydrogenase [Spirochaetes bacterium GWF1_41_5]HBE02826.1 zinc-binding dehydrogenase [Spirochaetia bacterium]